MCKNFGLGEEVNPAIFGEFLVDSVWKEDKKSIKAFAYAGESISKKNIQDLADVNCCAPNDEDIKDDDDKPIITVFDLPQKEADDFVRKKESVLVLDDLNEPLEPGGPMASFLTADVTDNNVLTYMITNNQYIAYQIWQLTGGNNFYPLPCTFAKINPRPSEWGDWAMREFTLTLDEKRNL